MFFYFSWSPFNYHFVCFLLHFHCIYYMTVLFICAKLTELPMWMKRILYSQCALATLYFVMVVPIKPLWIWIYYFVQLCHVRRHTINFHFNNKIIKLQCGKMFVSASHGRRTRGGWGGCDTPTFTTRWFHTPHFFLRLYIVASHWIQETDGELVSPTFYCRINGYCRSQPRQTNNH